MMPHTTHNTAQLLMEAGVHGPNGQPVASHAGTEVPLPGRESATLPKHPSEANPAMELHPKSSSALTPHVVSTLSNVSRVF